MKSPSKKKLQLSKEEDELLDKLAKFLVDKAIEEIQKEHQVLPKLEKLLRNNSKSVPKSGHSAHQVRLASIYLNFTIDSLQ